MKYNDRRFILRGAPTGNAAFLIKGETLHALFKLPLNPDFKKEVKELNYNQLKELQDLFQGCKLVVIDEKSMIGYYTLYMIDQRLKQITGQNTKEFGGLSVFLIGDFAQLPPMHDKALYIRKSNKLTTYQMLGKLLFKSCFEISIVFTQVMRQKGDDQKVFREFLDRLSNGKVTIDDWRDIILKRDFENLSPEEKKAFSEGDDVLMIASYIKDLKAYNVARVKRIGTPVALIQSENSDEVTANLGAKKAERLPSQIVIAKGCCVSLTHNIWKKAGLNTGARGFVRYIIYEKGCKPPSLPSLVFVDFPDYIGPPYFKDNPELKKCIPLAPAKLQWNIGKKMCWRKMYKFKLAYGTTVHSCQGRSCKCKVIINLGKKELKL